jgi:hypothetical protein
MHALKAISFAIVGLLCASVIACGGDSSGVVQPSLVSPSCLGVSLGPAPTTLSLPVKTPATMTILGNGSDTMRYSAEIAVRGATAYTTTWGARRVQGNKVNIWDVSGNAPLLVDSLIVTGAITTGDVAVSDDGTLLVVATEPNPGSIAVYDLTNPRKPQLLSRFTNDQTAGGVHTAELGRVNGKLYAFLSIDPTSATGAARLVIVDLSTPTAPRQVFVKIAGAPFVHDTYQRDGLLFVALWNDGVDIWDIGGCKSGASPENPRTLGNVRTIGGEVHNIWWYHDQNGSKRFAFVGEEGAGTIGASSRGDIHVIDISDPTSPKEVALYHVDGAGTHNFSVDEANGVLYAAYYNGGVRAIDVRGDLGKCPGNQQVLDAASGLLRCDLRLMGRELAIGLGGLNRNVYVWGVQYLNGTVYASDMVNGIWKLGAAK